MPGPLLARLEQPNEEWLDPSGPPSVAWAPLLGGVAGHRLPAGPGGEKVQWHLERQQG